MFAITWVWTGQHHEQGQLDANANIDDAEIARRCRHSGGTRWATCIPARLFFQQVPEDKVAKNRVHLDVRAAAGLTGAERMAALQAECDRLVALGATQVRRVEPAPPLEAGFIVLTDPEGNEFCLD
ncbi:hypothetical protein KIF24_15265 [Micromonospora sp. Llam7]|nr:hypothetical protein [Micromonospora tarapacensis]